MTENGVLFIFEQVAELTEIIQTLAKERPPEGFYHLGDKVLVGDIVFCPDYVEVCYTRYCGSNEYEREVKHFSTKEILNYI